MKTTIFFISFLMLNPLFCQKKNSVIFNPEKNYTQEFVDSIINNQISSTAEEYRKILESDKSIIGWSTYYMKKASESYYKQSDSTQHYADKSIQLFNKAEIKRPIDEKILITTYYFKSADQLGKREYKKAITNSQKALELTNTHYYKGRAHILNIIAASNSHMGNDSLALKYFLEVAKDTFFMSRPLMAINTYNELGGLYRNYKNDKTQSKKYYKKALRISDDSNISDQLDVIYGNLGDMSRDENKVDSTIYYYKKSIKAFEKLGPSDYAVLNDFVLVNKCYVKIYEGLVSEAIDSLKSVISRTEKVKNFDRNNNDLMSIAIETLAMAYQEMGDSSEYTQLLQMSTSFQNKFYNQQLNANLNDLEIHYQSKEKDASILQLEKNKKQQEVIITQQRYIAYGLGGFLLLFSGFAYLFWRQKKFKNQYEKENLEQRLLRSQMNPHFVSNALNSICGLVKNNSTQTIEYINNLGALFRLTLTNSREEFVSLEDELIALRSYLELQSKFSVEFKFSIEVESNIDQEEVLIPPMLIQPFVENAILHGFKYRNENAEISIKISKHLKSGLVFCEIIDNGIGYSKGLSLHSKKNPKSVSGDIVNERLNILKKKFKVEAKYTIQEIRGKGTCIEIYIPYLLDK
ncbi:histidine kinase [Aquimarina pacifica]|uniref:histidine kinase n=1 Tax=Aquimarina pacifica TaxID=1296415 RepID=UPI0004B9DB3B|nr:histidine kinase [Aquimarina pacifica]